jgi:hypothetical protein
MANAPNKFNPPNNVAPGYNFIPVTVGSVTGGFRALYVGTLGDVLITGFDDVSATFTNVQSGTMLPVIGKAIGTTASGTTAVGLVAIIG